MKIKIVYFAYLIPDKWESIVLEQLESLYSLTSLYEASQIYISVIDDTPEQTELITLRNIISEKFNKIQLINVFSTNVYEYPGIKTIYELSTPDEHEYLLYFHSKGMVSNQHETRKKLFEYTIKNYDLILTEMEKNLEIDTASAIPCINGFGYYNFFWARSSYVNKYCVKPETSQSFLKYDRYSWELWLGNHFSMKKNVITYSPVFYYNQAYEECQATYLMEVLLLRDDFVQIKNITSSTNAYNETIKLYSKSMNRIADNSFTDKNTVHSYFIVYEPLLYPKRSTAKNILEVGIYHGGSIQLWRDWFPRAHIYGVDICNLDFIESKKILNDHHVTLFTNTNAYDDTFIQTNFQDKSILFDMILDDGPHTLESNIWFIQKYLPLLAEDGILIIEDIQHFDFIDILVNIVPNEFKKYIQVYDLRQVNNCRYDDLIFVINKTI
jgi:hypothetical protein